MTPSPLAAAAALCLLVALVEAWLILAVNVKPASALARRVPGTRDLLRSHIDFLMMAQFLFVFHALLGRPQMAAPGWAVALACVGAVGNPTAFLVRALWPHEPAAAPKAFVLPATLSCVATTVGFLGLAWAVVARG